MKKLLILQEVKSRKCPLTRKRCLGDGCALWIDEGTRGVFSPRHSGEYRVGYCTLGRG